MDTKISDFSVEELKSIITKTVHEAIEDYLEVLKSLASKEFISSIQEARKDYKSGDL